MENPIEFETERLCLRQWLVEDYEPFAALNADPRVMEFFPALLDRAASDFMADYCHSLIAERGWGFWAVERKDTREFIGFVGLHTPAPELPFSPCVEIGWRLAYQHWRRGFATEAAKASLRIGFDTLGLSEIVSFTVPQNLRSRAVMERIGMHNAHENFEHPLVPNGHPLRLHCLYRLSRQRWQARETSEPETPP
jgi:RimJ/RimL family protein N-acetyltransferase